MEMINKIYCVDNIFSHANHISIPANNVRFSKRMAWEFDVPNETDEIVVYTETSFHKIIDNIPNRVAWLIESPEINRPYYDWISNNYHHFKYVLTHNRKLLEMGKNFKFVPLGGSWLWDDEIKIYKKTKNISMISSEKNQTYGHRLRHDIVKTYHKHLNSYGRGYQPIEHKIEGLKDYRFSICVENTKEDYYFSEKIMDCFLSGTIPIYWGCPSIADFFDLSGILSFNNIEELDEIINDCDESLYNALLPHVKTNFEKAKEYLLPEDWMMKNANIIEYENR